MKNFHKNGYIKLSRKILHWEHWDNLSVLKVFLSLLLIANRESNEWNGVQVERGETCITLDRLIELCKLSKNTVYGAIKALEKSGEIKREKIHNSITKIKIINYNLYQNNEQYSSKIGTDDSQNGSKIGTIDSSKIEPKQEYIYNKNNLLLLNKNNARTREAKVIADEMFSSGTIIEAFCKNENVSLKQARQLCDEVLNEWELTKPQHNNESEIRRHLLSHMRKKKLSMNLVHEDKDKRLKKLIDECKELINDGYSADKVREFYWYWIQPVNDNSGRMLFESVRAFDTITKFLTYYKNGRRT